ncbi:hypothetical protein K2173_010217 [Erythroxylum novogranatense]|uniref:Transmembrane protein n=1 Tax=Erythroxylum novogranatense TaxID=1862640 RepID=A0AAV8UAJ1_9ROSI|nr:hypothetical protein K2173_010217 [Erythroxylum novogranatense]
MEKHENMQKQGKRKVQINFKGVNIGGLVVWGGALAVVSLIAAFSVKKSRRKANDDNRTSENGVDNTVHESQSSTIYREQCCASFGSRKMIEAKIDSFEEQSPVSVINGQNEDSTVESEDILNTDDTNEENAELCRDCIKVEEISLGRTNLSGEDLQSTESVYLLGEKETCDRESINHNSLNNSVQEQSLKAVGNGGNENSTVDSDGIVLNNDPKEIVESCIGVEEFSSSDPTLCGTEKAIYNFSGEDLPVNEAVDMVYEKESSYVERSSSEDNSPNQSVEDDEGICDEVGCDDNNEEKDRSSCEDYIIENGEEEGSEEGTISSSAESRAEAIWPAEEIETLSLELESNVIKRENSEEKTTGKGEKAHLKDNQNKLVDDYEVLKKGNIMELGMMNDKMEHSRNWGVRVSRMVIGLLVLLLLLSIHRSALSYYLLNSELSSSHEV